jgi:hypothetical protein
MRTAQREHAIAAAREHATRRPSAAFVAAICDLLETARRTRARCEHCAVQPATHVRGGEGGKPIIVCAVCATRYERASPIERRRVNLAIARRPR